MIIKENLSSGEGLVQLIAAVLAASVLSWTPEVVQVDNVEPATMLALIHMESTGDEGSRRAGSKYHGLLQISQPYMDDALEYAGQPADTVDSLMGDGRYSLQIFSWHMQRCQSVHNWNPRHIALVHKAGPVGAQAILDRVGSGVTLIDAAEASSTPTAGEFMRRFDSFRQIYNSAITSNSEG